MLRTLTVLSIAAGIALSSSIASPVSAETTDGQTFTTALTNTVTKHQQLTKAAVKAGKAERSTEIYFYESDPTNYLIRITVTRNPNGSLLSVEERNGVTTRIRCLNPRTCYTRVDSSRTWTPSLHENTYENATRTLSFIPDEYLPTAGGNPTYDITGSIYTVTYANKLKLTYFFNSPTDYGCGDSYPEGKDRIASTIRLTTVPAIKVQKPPAEHIGKPQ